MFDLHERLAADTAEVARLELSLVRLMRDARWPWLILVPARAGITELHQLDAADRALLVEEIATVSRALERRFAPDKLNVGALGNLVPQLHVHVIARRRDDAAWPGPVWGVGTAEPYDDATLAATVAGLRADIAGAVA